jgi:glucokinase
MATYAGIDLGASNVRVIVGDGTGATLGSHFAETPQDSNGIAITETILETVRVACDDAGVDPTEIAAAGVGTIGPLNLAEGMVEDPANLPDAIEQIPLRGPISNLLATDDVFLQTDTNAGLIGERYFADSNPDDMIYLTISSGIGAGVAVDGNVLAGWDGNAGEVGHLQLDEDEFMPCGCSGGDGHWESYCSGTNIPHYAEALHEADPVDTSLPVEEGLSAHQVFSHADDGDEFAQDVLDKVGRWNAIGVANMVHAFAPLVVYVGGAVALNNPEATLDPIREHLPDMVMTNVPEVKLTALGDDVVVKGALATAITGGAGERAHR